MNHDDNCIKWSKGKNIGFEDIKSHGLAAIKEQPNDPKVAFDSISDMMVLQMTICGDIIEPPFQPFKALALAGNGLVFANECKASKVTNNITEMYIYALYAYRWTVSNTENDDKKAHKDNLANILLNIDSTLKTWESNYCDCERPLKGTDAAVNQALEKCFNEKKRTLHQIVRSSSSRLKTVCSIDCSRNQY